MWLLLCGLSEVRGRAAAAEVTNLQVETPWWDRDTGNTITKQLHYTATTESTAFWLAAALLAGLFYDVLRTWWREETLDEKRVKQVLYSVMSHLTVCGWGLFCSLLFCSSHAALKPHRAPRCTPTPPTAPSTHPHLTCVWRQGVLGEEGGGCICICEELLVNT